MRARREPDFATAYVHVGLRVPGVVAGKRWNFYTLNSRYYEEESLAASATV